MGTARKVQPSFFGSSRSSSSSSAAQSEFCLSSSSSDTGLEHNGDSRRRSFRREVVDDDGSPKRRHPSAAAKSNSGHSVFFREQLPCCLSSPVCMFVFIPASALLTIAAASQLLWPQRDYATSVFLQLTETACGRSVVSILTRLLPSVFLSATARSELVVDPGPTSFLTTTLTAVALTTSAVALCYLTPGFFLCAPLQRLWLWWKARRMRIRAIAIGEAELTIRKEALFRQWKKLLQEYVCATDCGDVSQMAKSKAMAVAFSRKLVRVKEKLQRLRSVSRLSELPRRWVRLASPAAGETVYVEDPCSMARLHHMSRGERRNGDEARQRSKPREKKSFVPQERRCRGGRLRERRRTRRLLSALQVLLQLRRRRQLCVRLIRADTQLSTHKDAEKAGEAKPAAKGEERGEGAETTTPEVTTVAKSRCSSRGLPAAAVRVRSISSGTRTSAGASGLRGRSVKHSHHRHSSAVGKEGRDSAPARSPVGGSVQRESQLECQTKSTCEQTDDDGQKLSLQQPAREANAAQRQRRAVAVAAYKLEQLKLRKLANVCQFLSSHNQCLVVND